MNYNLDFFVNKIESNRIDYSRILRNRHNILNKEPVELSIIIGTKGRDRYLKKCLDYLNYSLSHCGIKSSVIVVQHDHNPTHKNICIKHNCSYVFVPIEETNTENQYSRSLAYNIGYFANPDVNTLIFHDIDVLFPHDYFKIYEEHYYRRGIKWLQNFNGKSLYCLDREQSKKIFDLNGISNLYVFPDSIKGGPGAAGGSVTCNKDLFLEVGGYDPEIFYGWAPEDSMFWTKLLCTQIEPGPMRNCHQFSNIIDYVYADTPPLRLYHLFHDPVPNAKWGEMQEIHDSFWSFSYEDKMKYIEIKRKLFKI